MKKTFKSLLAITGLLLTFSAQAQVPQVSQEGTQGEGDGSKNNPYLISSKADMEALAAAVNGGNSYSGKYFLLTSDLTGENTVTTSVGSYIANSIWLPFCGIFDGGGHEIELQSNTGVFGFLYDATVQNLGVKGEVSAFSSTTDVYAGGICGAAIGATTIIYCYNSAAVTSTTTSAEAFSRAYAGGICGQASSFCYIELGTCTSPSISNCYNLGAITATSNKILEVGGICGYSGGSVSNCYNVGSISSSFTTSSDITNSWNSFAGGICGGTCGEEGINNCFAANSVITTQQFYPDHVRSNVCKIGGSICVTHSLNNCYALSSMSINGVIRSSTDANGQDGRDAELSSFQSQSWLQTNLGWDFNTVWMMGSKGFPILQVFGGKGEPSGIPVTGVTLNKPTATLAVSATEQLVATIQPTDATNTAVTWSSSNPAVATVSASGEITAVSAGTATITVTTVDGDFTASCEVTVSQEGTQGEGDGSKNNPYLISSKADMEALAAAVNGGNSYSGKYFLLTSDLTGENTVTTSIGSHNGNLAEFNSHNTDLPFSGVFDGGGHEIELQSANGVFGLLYNAIIQNLGVKGTVFASSLETFSCVGGICGTAFESTINYYYNSAEVTSISASVAGGICGDAASGTIISNCYNLGNVSYTSTDRQASSSVGGICGLNNGRRGSISNCYNLGDVSSSTPSCCASSAGGVCGSSGSGNISNCFAANSFITSNHYYSARICGERVFTNCYALSSMTLNGSTVSSTDVNGQNGCDAELSSFQSQSWLQTNLGWDFNTVWMMGSKGFPILQVFGGKGEPSGIPVTGVTLNKPTATLAISATEQLVATIQPTDATNQQVAWNSSNTSVATVSESGLVTALAAGTATITATTVDGGKIATCTVIVHDIVEGEPAGANGQGSISFTLPIPSNVPFTGSFTIELPAGLILDIIQTALSEDLASLYNLVITNKGNGKWTLSMAPKSQSSSPANSGLRTVRSASELVAHKLLDIVYTVAEGTTDGDYEAKITDLVFNFADETVIAMDNAIVPIKVDHTYTSPTGTGNVAVEKLQIYPNPTSDVVYIKNANGAEVKVYNLNGALLHRTRESRVDLSGEPSGVYLLRVGGETLKVVKK